MRLILFIAFFCFLLTYGDAQCTFDSTLQGTWTSSNYGTITIDSSTVTLVLTISGVSGNRVFNCQTSSSSTYVVISQDSISALGTTGNAVICFEFNIVNSNSYYFYMNSPTSIIFNNERIAFWETTPSLSQACNENPPTAEFNSIIRSGSEESAITNCMSLLLGNFNYKLTTSGGTTDCTNDNITVCTTRQELQFYETVCSFSMFSVSGRLGCINGGIYDSTVDGGTYYGGMYNFDSTVNQLTTFRFTCIAVKLDGTNIKITSNPKRCEGSQTATTRPTSGQLHEVTNTIRSCPFTDDSVNVLAIVLGVIFGLIFLLLLALLIYICCKKKKKRDKRKATTERNLKIFEKKMAMDEFDDDHPLNESSLVPDFPQNGYPEPLKLSPRSKKYTFPKAVDVEIQTDRSYTSEKDFDPRSSRGLGGPAKTFHGSNRTLATQKDFEGPPDTVSDQRLSVFTRNKTLENKLLYSNKQPVEFPSEPQYLPWPWRTANRAMKSHSTSVKSDAPSFKSYVKGLPDLGEYTIKNYGIKYDDTLSSVVTHPPPRRPLSRSNSVYDLSRPPTRMMELKKSVSHEHLNTSRSKTSFGDYPIYPTKSSLLGRSVSQNDKTIRKHDERKTNHYLLKPQSLPDAPSRRASIASVKSILHRSNTRMLKTISESRERIPTPLKIKRKPPIPSYMRPLTRSKTTIPKSTALKKAANVYGKRPTTGKLVDTARSMLQTKLKHKSMEQPLRRKKKKLRKKKSSWRSPFSLPSSFQPQPLSLRTLSKIKNAKVVPSGSSKTGSKLNESFTSREFATTDYDVTSDSNAENFMDAETWRLPEIKQKTQLVSGQPVREKTYRMDKKLTEDSGISADESVVSTSDDTRFPLPDITNSLPLPKPGTLKPPPRRQPWH